MKQIKRKVWVSISPDKSSMVIFNKPDKRERMWDKENGYQTVEATLTYSIPIKKKR